MNTLSTDQVVFVISNSWIKPKKGVRPSEVRSIPRRSAGPALCLSRSSRLTIAGAADFAAKGHLVPRRRSPHYGASM